LLLVDASQGVEAQTLANLYAAMEHDLVIIPVINKIDLPSADIDRTRDQIETDLGLDPEGAVLCSAKEGLGIVDVLEAICQRIPPPRGSAEAPAQALIFDAFYDPFRGTIVSLRVFNGRLRPGRIIRLMHTGARYKVEEVGVFRLHREPRPELSAGQVGYLIAGIKAVADVRVGDTVTLDDSPAALPLPGFKAVKPVVFSSIYPVSADDYPSLTEALEKFKLNDASLIYQKDSSAALGMGFRCGFLGLLHLDIVQERLEREFDQSVIMTAPSVEYHLTLKNGTATAIDNPERYPDP
jgi:GTP-binding protein LepA